MFKNKEIFLKSKKLFWQLSAPLIVLTFFQACYSFVDIFWISKMNADSFFAISVALPIFTLITSFGLSLGVGTNSIIAREIGERNQKKAYNSLLHGIVACFMLGLIIMLSTLLIKNLLIFINATSQMDLSTQYLTPIFLCSHVFLFSNLFQSTMRAEGNSKTPTNVLILTNILNLILDPIFIFSFNLGVSGAAYATILSSTVATLWLLYYYLSGKTEIKLSFKYFKLGIVYDIFIVAIPNFVNDLLNCIVMVYFNVILIQQLGQLGVLLHSTAGSLESLIMSPQTAFSISMITVSGQLFGAREFDEIEKIYHYVLKLSILIAIITTVLVFFIRDYVFALFSVTNAEFYVFYITFAGMILIPFNVTLILSMKMLDGMGKSYHSFFLTIILNVVEMIIVMILSEIIPNGIGLLFGIVLSIVGGGIGYFIIVEYIIKLKGKEDFLQRFFHKLKMGSS
jgi:putative MATE family efflux protein